MTARTLFVSDLDGTLLGPGAAVLNCTELKPGDEILGYLPGRERHVGYPINEQCFEQ